jgi:hypothetical protein
VAQHFLMSAAARTLSLVDLCDLSKDAAHKMLCEMRWEDTDGAPVCPHCSCPAVYTYRCRRVFKCKACHRQFSAYWLRVFYSDRLEKSVERVNSRKRGVTRPFGNNLRSEPPSHC